MFFLVRCLFWLGLVFMALPWDSASLRADISSQAEQATRAASAQAQAYCAKDPLGCASQAIALGKAFDLAAAAPSQDTLHPRDLAPVWRGPSTVAASRR